MSFKLCMRGFVSDLGKLLPPVRHSFLDTGCVFSSFIILHIPFHQSTRVFFFAYFYSSEARCARSGAVGGEQ